MIELETLDAAIDIDLKHHAEAVLKDLGLSSSQAISLFYKQIVSKRHLPLDYNEETKEAMLDVMLKRNISKPHTFEEFKKEFFSC
jgi:DNA-damage-inducible protein J